MELAITLCCLLTDHFSLHCYNRLSAPPETLDQLGDSLALLEQLQQDLSNIEAKFPPLHQQFAILEKYEVAIPEEVRRRETLTRVMCLLSKCVTMQLIALILSVTFGVTAYYAVCTILGMVLY